MQDHVKKQISTKTNIDKKCRRNQRKRPPTFPVDLQVRLQSSSSPMDRETITKRLKKLMKNQDINAVTTSGVTVLTQCALDGILDTIKILVELGADVNKRDYFGWTALHYAASEGYVEICRYLLQHGANTRIEDDEGKLPVEVTDDDEILRLLLRATMMLSLPPMDSNTSIHSF
ncbi:protein phosphatase 1 regulatory subunit 27-like [Nematostella vectensis]|uniref:protein phosphatase 1 regulatory subunit 27-like n=1 Tax=Nematostella vectensis TaxID=45351 RepID=UPI0020777505|nr:protein phosphatase 1 regulatory subunit 27-like [Nematostella vectensis]